MNRDSSLNSNFVTEIPVVTIMSVSSFVANWPPESCQVMAVKKKASDFSSFRKGMHCKSPSSTHRIWISFAISLQTWHKFSSHYMSFPQRLLHFTRKVSPKPVVPNSVNSNCRIPSLLFHQRSVKTFITSRLEGLRSVCELSGHYLWTFPWFLDTKLCAAMGPLATWDSTQNPPTCVIQWFSLPSIFGQICTTLWVNINNTEQ